MNRFTTIVGGWLALFLSVDGLVMLLLSDPNSLLSQRWSVGARLDSPVWVTLACIFLTGGFILGYLLGMPDADLPAGVDVRRVRREARAKAEKARETAVAPKAAASAPAATSKPATSVQSRQVWAGAGEQIHVLVLQPGEEALAAIDAFARDKGLKAASITAVGAFERATVGWFDRETKACAPIEVEEPCAVLSLLGDVATGADGVAGVHLHAVLGLRDGSTRGGRLLKATVRPTLEVVVTETPAHLRRRLRPDVGAALIDPGD